MSEKFYEYLKRVRRSAGMTQEQAAAILGMSRSAYLDLESGRRQPRPSEEFGIRPTMDQLPKPQTGGKK